MAIFRTRVSAADGIAARAAAEHLPMAARSAAGGERPASLRAAAPVIKPAETHTQDETRSSKQPSRAANCACARAPVQTLMIRYLTTPASLSLSLNNTTV